MLFAAETNVASQAPVLPGVSGTSAICMLSSFKIWASGAQDRATWYIRNTAVWPDAGSGFSLTFFSVVAAGCSEQPAKKSASAAVEEMANLFIISCRHSNE